MPETLQSFKSELFKALAHPTRIRILELLRQGERSVTELQVALAAEGSTVSQQLAVLRTRDLVATRKDGNLIYYRIRHRHVWLLLDIARRMFDEQVTQLSSLAEQEKSAESVARAATKRRRVARPG
jgi:ArsR family transcriptional regulator